MPVGFNQSEPSASQGVVKTYIARVRAFSPNARKYLLSIIIFGAGMGVYRILFNFYLRSLGYDETFMGLLSTISSMTVLFSALPMGYFADILGRKISLVISGLAIGIALITIASFPVTWVFVAMNILMGLGSCLGGVVSGPFLMENSGERSAPTCSASVLGCAWQPFRLANGWAAICPRGLAAFLMSPRSVPAPMLGPSVWQASWQPLR
jgi:MFS family permease